jgi:hypothetical protein
MIETLDLLAHPQRLHQLKIKLKGRHFDTIEMIETESQAVVNTPTKHDFKDAVKKWRKHRGQCIHEEVDCFLSYGGQ